MKSSLIINSIDANNQARQKSFPNINPNATDANVCTFAKKVNALTTNEFVSAIRVDKKPLDDSTPEPVVKQTPTLTLSEFTKDGTTYTATITYNGDGELTTTTGSIDDVTLIVEATETFSGTLSAPETDNFLAASVEFRYVIKQTPTLSVSDFTVSNGNFVAAITYDGDGTLSTNLGTISNRKLYIPDSGDNFNGTVTASETDNFLAASADFVCGVKLKGDLGASNVYLSGTAGHDSLHGHINNGFTAMGGAGNDTITMDLCNNVLVDAGDGDDYIPNAYTAQASPLTVFGGKGNDSIYDSNNGPSTIYGGEGNDSIRVTTGEKKVYGDAGNDTINTRHLGSGSVYGGAGDDFIKDENSFHVTISGGTGNDTILLSSIWGDSPPSRLIVYNAGDGNDSISGFGNVDTLKIVGSTFTTTTSGDDVIVNVGSEYITIQGGATVSPLNIVSA